MNDVKKFAEALQRENKQRRPIYLAGVLAMAIMAVGDRIVFGEWSEMVPLLMFVGLFFFGLFVANEFAIWRLHRAGIVGKEVEPDLTCVICHSDDAPWVYRDERDVEVRACDWHNATVQQARIARPIREER